MDSTSRRDFLKATAATLGAAAVTSGEAAAGPAQAAPDTLLFSAPPLDRVRVGFVGVGGMGTVHLENYLALEGVELKAVCDIDPAHAERARKKVVDAGQPVADALHEGRPRFRADVRRRAARPRLHRHAVGMARARDAGRAQDRQARGDGSAGGLSRGRLLGAGRSGGEVQEARRDDGELLLRPARDAGADAGAQGHARRAPARRVRLPARPAGDQVLDGGRRALAARARRSSATATCTRRTGSGRSRSASTSTAATSSSTWSR